MNAHPKSTFEFRSALASLKADGYSDGRISSPIWFGDSAELNASLNDLVLAGLKTATASLLWAWEAIPFPPPAEHEFQIMLDWDNTILAVLKNVRIDIVEFGKVRENFTRLEGEGDLSLEWWRAAHWDYFSSECDNLGLVPSETMPVVCQQFKIIFPPDALAN
jgi:uncharacterized protein YhfF